MVWAGSSYTHMCYLLITLRQKAVGNEQNIPEQFLQDGTTLLGVHVCLTPCFIWDYPKHKDPGSIEVRRSLPAGKHKERLAQALPSRNKNALDYLPNRQKCSHRTSQRQSHFCPSLPIQVRGWKIWAPYVAGGVAPTLPVQHIYFCGERI